MAADTADLSRLTTFQHHIDDMRNLAMCKICLKPLYEPFILACGHTYCYGCLRSWFSGLESRKRKKNCPDCRAEVNLSPSPNYILRDLVHMFINRTELLPEGETVEEHMAAKLAEADLLASDKEGDGMFQGLFKAKCFRIPGYGPLYDNSDHVYRCPLCHHELEHGECLQCGYEVREDDDWPDLSDEDDEEDSMMGDESIASNTVSNSSGHSNALAIPHHFYGGRSLAEIVEGSMDSDTYSDPEFDRPQFYSQADDDEDEMDGFIDDQDEDEPDEIDEDDMGDPTISSIPRPRARRYQIPDDDDVENEEEEESQWSNEDDDSDNDEEEEGAHQGSWPASTTLNGSDISDKEEDEVYGDEDSNQDQQTNYDESDEESRNSTPVPMPIVPRRRPIIISDDEDEDEEGGDDESRTDGRPGAIVDTDGNTGSSDSDDTTTPPQPSANRRQRLDNHRKRRQTPDNWRTIARGRGERSSSGRESRPRNHEIRQVRPGSHYLSVPS